MNSIITTDRREPSPSSSPWWMQAIERFGVFAAIAAYLVYSMVGGQSSTLNEINTTLQAQKITVAEVVTVTKKTAADAEEARSRQEAYLRLVCVNTSKNQTDRSTCLSVR